MDDSGIKKESASYGLFTGVVISSNAATYAVTVAREGYMAGTADGGNMMQGIALSSQLAGFLGFRDAGLPQAGTRVLCASVAANLCYVIASIPQNNRSSESIPGRTILGAGCATQDSSNRVGHADKLPVIPNNRRPADVVDGEHVISNEFGVMLGMFQQLAVLKASELAQVQCHLMDDLVRLISHNFQHYSALGEYNIWHDGKSLQAEFGATHIPGEMYGRPMVDSESGAPVFQETSSASVDDAEDFYKISEDERIKAIERFKIFLGKLGDFIHIFLLKPDNNEVRTLNPDKRPNSPDTGLFDFHLGTDGGVHVRSVKEVFIEKTNWIRVPVRCAAPDDPKGDAAEDITYEDKEPFEWKNDYKYKNNPFGYFLQLRDYVAYASEKLAYQNFKKHEKDFYVNDTASKEKNLKNIQKVDKNTKLDQTNYDLRTSGVYIMPNGGIVIRDAWNSAIVMEGGNIYLQPAKDFVMQPLRNLVAKVGGFVSIGAKKDIDLSSTERGFRLKTEKSQYFYSDKSGIVLEANPSQPGSGTPDPSSQAIEDIGGIVLKSKQGIYNYAEKEIVAYSKDKMILKAVGNTVISSDGLFGLNTSGTMIIKGNQLIANGESTALYLSTGGTASFAGSGSSVFGNKDDNLGIMYDKDSMFIDILKGAFPVSSVASQLQSAYRLFSDPLSQTTFSDVSKFTKLKFRFLDSNKYGNIQKETDAIPATMAQQDDKLTSLYSLGTWTEKEVNGSLPYPGKTKFTEFYLDADAPKNLETNPSGKSYSSKADSSKTPGKLTFKSLQQYKIQSN